MAMDLISANRSMNFKHSRMTILGWKITNIIPKEKQSHLKRERTTSESSSSSMDKIRLLKENKINNNFNGRQLVYNYEMLLRLVVL